MTWKMAPAPVHTTATVAGCSDPAQHATCRVRTPHHAPHPTPTPTPPPYALPAPTSHDPPGFRVSQTLASSPPPPVTPDRDRDRDRDRDGPAIRKVIRFIRAIMIRAPPSRSRLRVDRRRDSRSLPLGCGSLLPALTSPRSLI